jgi:hypothetical protein
MTVSSAHVCDSLVTGGSEYTQGGAFFVMTGGVLTLFKSSVS